MKKEDLKAGKELQLRIDSINEDIDRITTQENVVSNIAIDMLGKSWNLIVSCRNSKYTEKAKTNLEYLNQLYRDNVLRTLEDCKNELEKEFELLGK